MSHCQTVKNNLQKTCGIFFMVRYLLPTSTLITLYNALFMSFLQYGIVAWGQTFDSYIEPLFKLQKRAVRAISHQPFLAHSLPIFKDLKLLRIVDIFKLKLLFFFTNQLIWSHQSVSKTFSFWIQRFIVIIQDNRLVMICFWLIQTHHNMAWNQFDIWEQNYGMNYLLQ